MPHFSRLRSGHQSADTVGFALDAHRQSQFHHTDGCSPSQPDTPLAVTIQGKSNHPARYYGNGDLHFITSSCYRREPLLGTPRRRDLFLTVLEQVRRHYQFVVVGYVVMPEHIHLLISEPQGRTPSTVIQALKLAFACRVLRPMRRRRTSDQGILFAQNPRHIWQKRFYDFNVWSARKRIEKLRYMHRNPVKSGLVASPELWRWSSYRAYAFGELGPVRVNDWDVLKMKVRKLAA